MLINNVMLVKIFIAFDWLSGPGKGIVKDRIVISSLFADVGKMWGISFKFRFMTS